MEVVVVVLGFLVVVVACWVVSGFEDVAAFVVVVVCLVLVVDAFVVPAALDPFVVVA